MAPSAMTNGSADPFQTLVRHSKYYIQSADLCFLLGHVQFRVHRYFFERESAYYRGKLTLPVSPGATRQGSTDSEPIVLDDVTPEAFEKLCWVFYNPRYSLYDGSVDDWTSILSLSHKWGFMQVKALAVRELEKKDFSNIDRIVVYQTNDVDRNLLIPHYAALCARESPLTLPEGMKLGMETTLLIASAREYVRAAKLADGSRSPISPTAEGDELVSIIRDMFGIAPAPIREEVTSPSSTSKDSASVSKTEVDGESNSIITASATAAAAAKSTGSTTNPSGPSGGIPNGGQPATPSTPAKGGAPDSIISTASNDSTRGVNLNLDTFLQTNGAPTNGPSPAVNGDGTGNASDAINADGDAKSLEKRFEKASTEAAKGAEGDDRANIPEPESPLAARSRKGGPRWRK